ncbi:CpaF family protein [Paenibacillus aquistagni]|uniref:CpaF family protein n=1 Tax=Paenibacillus aquistagni TaxID=1852522 RepID=UPI0014828468|nr:ATPase, T2SS/T4P/T4SS family [Paenibacillus aquistagni]
MTEEQILEHLQNRLQHRLHHLSRLSNEQLRERIRTTVLDYSKEAYLTHTQINHFTQRLYDMYRGLDVVQPLMDDPHITAIMINSYDEIYIEREGSTVLSEQRFESQEAFIHWIYKITEKVRPSTDELPPLMDVRFENESHVNIVMPPVAVHGPTMTIHKRADSTLTIDKWINKGSIPKDAARLLQNLVRCKYNILISGETRSGKTTLLNALTNSIPNDERIITIEDIAELHVDEVPNRVQMEAWRMTSDGLSRSSIRELIHRSLRMGANRLVLGEIRGAEAADLMQAMNGGLDGSLSTVNACSAEDVLNRLETMMLAGGYLPAEVVRKQICSAIDIIVHVARLSDQSRRIVEISEVLGVRNGCIQLNPIYLYKDKQDKALHPSGSLRRTSNEFVHTAKLYLSGMRENEWMLV